jgi:tetratricopeptide (TPR) repeat protein
VGREHTHATTYFATRILYQRGKLDLPGVMARLTELLRSCPDFPEAEAMLAAAHRGTLRPDPRSFNQATVPPPPVAPRDKQDTDDDDNGDRLTDPGRMPSSLPVLEARLKTPQAPGIPRAPLVPRFTPRENVAPSYVPPPEEPGSAPENTWSDTLSAPPPSSNRALQLDSPSEVAIDLGMLDGLAQPLGERNTAPSPGAPGWNGEPPTAFAIATWLSERDFERALAAVEKLGAESSPELSLLEVRALVGLGRKAAARRSLERLCRAPLLDPDLRAAVARLLIDLGDLDRAAAQARRALAEDPRSELTRLTLAWAVTRSDAWLLTTRSATELSELLAHVTPEASPLPALAYALSALVLLGSSPEAARQAVDAALALDGDSPDALAVAVVIAQKQRRTADAKQLNQRLLQLDHHAADELSAGLDKLDLGAGRSSAEAPERPAPATTPWNDKEHRLALGDGKAALFEFEQGLSRKLESLPLRSTPNELSTAAMLTARYLTQAPICRHFAPFDLSLFSIARLDVALGLLYRGGVGPRTELRTRVLLGLGAYLGECWRQAYAGDWVGGAVDLLRMHIEGQGLCFSPFSSMNARLQSAEPLQVGDTPLPHPGAEPLGQRVALSVSPPAPWDPSPWPELSQMPELGGKLRESPVGLYCAGVELPLDLSFASLRSLDRYVTLLAPPLAPSDPEAPWVRRAAVLVGAYMGEVLRATRGGVWEPLRGDLRAEAYRIALPGNVKALPVASAFERLSGRRLEQPSDYARRITG